MVQGRRLGRGISRIGFLAFAACAFSCGTNDTAAPADEGVGEGAAPASQTEPAAAAQNAGGSAPTAAGGSGATEGEPAAGSAGDPSDATAAGGEASGEGGTNSGGGSADSGDSGADSAGSAGDASDAGSSGGPSCQPIGARVNAPALLFAVDTSGSMNDAVGDDPLDTTMPTKWDITRDQLVDALTALPSEVAVGLLYFPYGGGFGGGFGEGGDVGPDPTECEFGELDVPIAALGPEGSAQREAISVSLVGREPNGFTPTHSALAFAVQAVSAYPADGERFIVLITDGRPTRDISCNDLDMYADVLAISQPIIDESEGAAADGVRTFVIGSPGSEEAAPALSRIASVAGTARAADCNDDGPDFCHFDTTTQAVGYQNALAEALSAITQVIACEFALPDLGVTDPSALTASLTDSSGTAEPLQVVANTQSCNDSGGVSFSGDAARLTLCPATCAALAEDPEKVLRVGIGCN